MKVYVEELDITAELPDGLSDAQIRDMVNDNLLETTKFKDSTGNRMNKFENLQDAQDEKIRQQMIDETGIIESYEPNFYEKWIRSPLQRAGMLPSLMQDKSAYGLALKKPEDPSKVDMFVLTGMGAFTGLNFFPRHTPEQLEGADPSISIPIPFLGETKIAPLRFAGGLAGGVGALMTARGAIKEFTMLPYRTAQLTMFAAKFSPKLARFIPGAILSGATFGTTALVQESMSQAQQGNFDIESLSGKVITNTGLGIALGLLAPGAVTVFPKNAFFQQSSAIAGAGAIGFQFAKSQGANDADALLHGGIFAIFQAIGGTKMDAEMNRQMIENVSVPLLAKYARTMNPNMSKKASMEIAMQFFVEQARPYGGLENVYKGKLTKQVPTLDGKGYQPMTVNVKNGLMLELIEAWNQKAIHSLEKFIRTKGPRKPGAPTGISITGKGPVTPAPKAGQPVEPRAAGPVTPAEPAPEPIETKLRPVPAEYQGAVDLAKQFETMQEFQNALMLPENQKIAEGVSTRVREIIAEEAPVKLGIDTVKLKALLETGKSSIEAIMELKGVSQPDAIKIEKQYLNMVEQVQADALQQIFSRAQVQKAVPVVEVPEPTGKAVTLPVTQEAQALADVMQQQLGEQPVKDALALAEKIATATGKDAVTSKEFMRAVEIKDANTYAEKVIQGFPSSDFTAGSWQFARDVFDEELANRLLKASEDYQKWMDKFNKEGTRPSEKALKAKVASLIKKYGKPKKPKKEPTDIIKREQDKIKKMKKQKDVDILEKNDKGEPILYKVTIDGNEIEVLATSEAFGNLQPVEFIEIVRITNELLGKLPRPAQEIKKEPGFRGFFLRRKDPKTGEIIFIEIGLNPLLFERGNELLLAKVLAHELGHLVDYLEPSTIDKSNLLGKLVQMKEFMKETFGELTNKKMFEEMMKLSNLIRPWDQINATPKHVAYRHDPDEIYADFISALFFSPGLIEKNAPTALKVFLDKMDANIKFKDAFLQIQKMLHGAPEEIFKSRSTMLREWFVKGKQLLEQIAKDRALRRKFKWIDLHDALVEKYGPIIRKEDIDKTKGLLPEPNSPIHALQENRLADNAWWKAVASIQQNMLDKLKEVGIDELTAAEYIFLTRVVGNPAVKPDDFSGLFEAFDTSEHEKIRGFIEALVKKGFADRKDLANPGGFAPKTAQDQLDFMKKSMGEEKFAYMEKLSKVFRDEVWEIVNDSFDAGTYPKSLKPQLEANKDYYATFAVLNYLTGHIPPSLMKQWGTLSPVANPINSTLMKLVSLARWNSHNRAARSVVEMVQRVEGKQMKGLIIKPRRVAADKGIITVFEDGRARHYIVAKDVADSFNGNSTDMNLLVNALDKWLGNKFFKHVFITYNITFAALTNLQRDFKANLITLSAFDVKKPIRTLFKAYLKNNKIAKEFTKGQLDEILQEMIDTKAMGKPFSDFSFHLDEDPVTRTLRELELLKAGPGVSTLQTNNIILKPVYSLLNWIKFIGSKNEILSKIAMYDIMKEKITDDKQRAMFTRVYAGTPDFRAGGTVTQTTNVLFMFSNIQIQDAIRNKKMADNPQTKAGWWRAILQYELLPKLIMKLAALGLAGAFLKGLYDDIPEYDKTNYTVIPLGRAFGKDDDRVIYMRLVPSGMGGIIAGLFWKTLGLFDKKKNPVKDLVQALDYAGGQLPGVSPGVELTGALGTYITGRNPYDAFYGDQAIPETEYRAGGMASHKAFGLWMLKKGGFGQYFVETDKRDNWFEAFIRHTPGINSLIKISDRGFVERARDITEEIEKENAQEKLKREEIFQENATRLEAGESFKDVFEDVKNEFFGAKETKKKKSRSSVMTLRGQFIAFNQEESDATPIIVLLKTPTNEGKARILRDIIRPRMTAENFDTFTKNMFKFNVISRDVRVRMKQLNKENTK